MTQGPRDDSGFIARYEIRIRGRLDAGWSDWFAGCAVTAEDGDDTVLAADLDQAALHAVLRRIRDLALPLVCLRRIEPGRTTPRESIERPEDRS